MEVTCVNSLLPIFLFFLYLFYFCWEWISSYVLVFDMIIFSTDKDTKFKTLNSFLSFLKDRYLKNKVHIKELGYIQQTRL